jgi:hypothetical protein
MKPEEIDQINFMNWVDFNLPEIAPDVHHFANERWLGNNPSALQAGRKLKRMGVKAGVSDIFVAVPKNGKGGLWIELKVGKNKPSPAQTAFLERKRERGYEAVCVWGWEAAKVILLTYLETK